MTPRLAPALLALSLLLAPSWALAFTVPGNDGFMTDATGILTPEQDAEVERILADYRRQTTNEIAVLIAPSLEGEHIADVAVQVGRAWKVGSKEDDNGILVLISYGDREAFIATGYGLEGAVPDLTAKSIVENEMIPFFREGQYYEGILAGIDALKQSIGGEYVAQDSDSESDVDYGSIIIILLFIGINAMRFLGVFLAKTKSWWLGGVIGAGFGALTAIFLAWWWTVPLMAIAGLLFDYFVSKYGWASNSRRRRGNWYIGGGGFGGGGGGFGGFGGGSFGGGGAGGKW